MTPSLNALLFLKVMGLKLDFPVIIKKRNAVDCVKRNVLRKTHLHSNDTVDEKDETDKDCDPGQGLERFDEGPEQGSNTLSLAE